MKDKTTQQVLTLRGIEGWYLKDIAEEVSLTVKEVKQICNDHKVKKAPKCYVDTTLLVDNPCK